MGKNEPSGSIRVRIDPPLKAAGDAILDELGVTPSGLITMLYKAVVRNGAIPDALMTFAPLDVATAVAHAEIARGDFAEFADVAALLADLHGEA